MIDCTGPEWFMDRWRLAGMSRVVGDCVIFEGATTKKGYGRFWLGAAVTWAHRAARHLFVGDVKVGQPVMHKPECNTRDCINPDHTRPGTVQENNAEVNAKRRART